jgi:hypothetical protein
MKSAAAITDLVSLPLNKYGKVEVDFFSDQGTTNEQCGLAGLNTAPSSVIDRRSSEGAYIDQRSFEKA